jgi:hypothetical protein
VLETNRRIAVCLLEGFEARPPCFVCDGTRWMWYVALSIMQVLHEMPELWANCSLMNRGKAHQGHS